MFVRATQRVGNGGDSRSARCHGGPLCRSTSPYAFGDRHVQADADVEDAVCSALVALDVMRTVGSSSFALRPRHLLGARRHGDDHRIWVWLFPCATSSCARCNSRSTASSAARLGRQRGHLWIPGSCLVPFADSAVVPPRERDRLPTPVIGFEVANARIASTMLRFDVGWVFSHRRHCEDNVAVRCRDGFRPWHCEHNVAVRCRDGFRPWHCEHNVAVQRRDGFRPWHCEHNVAVQRRGGFSPVALQAESTQWHCEQNIAGPTSVLLPHPDRVRHVRWRSERPPRCAGAFVAREAGAAGDERNRLREPAAADMPTSILSGRAGCASIAGCQATSQLWISLAKSGRRGRACPFSSTHRGEWRANVRFADNAEIGRHTFGCGYCGFLTGRSATMRVHVGRRESEVLPATFRKSRNPFPADPTIQARRVFSMPDEGGGWRLPGDNLAERCGRAGDRAG